MSTDCENLLKKFLVLNPQKRLSLEVGVSFDIDLLILETSSVHRINQKSKITFSMLQSDLGGFF